MSTSCSDKKRAPRAELLFCILFKPVAFLASRFRRCRRCLKSPEQMNATLACEQAFWALWRRGGKRKESLQLRL